MDRCHLVDLIPIVCPNCGETFEIPPPERTELSDRLDYDCEVCCRPMILDVYEDENGDVAVEAVSLDGSE